MDHKYGVFGVWCGKTGLCYQSLTVNPIKYFWDKLGQRSSARPSGPTTAFDPTNVTKWVSTKFSRFRLGLGLGLALQRFWSTSKSHGAVFKKSGSCKRRTNSIQSLLGWWSGVAQYFCHTFRLCPHKNSFFFLLNNICIFCFWKYPLEHGKVYRNVFICAKTPKNIPKWCCYYARPVCVAVTQPQKEHNKNRKQGMEHKQKASMMWDKSKNKNKLNL